MQRIRNYGSFLQAHGLRSLLEELGCEVRFVDYKPGPCLVEQKASRLPRPAAKLVEVLGGPGPLSAKLSYANYKRRYDGRAWPLLGLPAEPDYRTDNLDMLAIGSDEVFNCVQANPNVGFSADLFGASCQAGRLISYAASCGNTTLAKLDRYEVSNTVADWLARFDALSCVTRTRRQWLRLWRVWSRCATLTQCLLGISLDGRNFLLVRWKVAT